MKFNYNISSSRRKNRKRYFNSSSGQRRKNMVTPLCNELKKKYRLNKLSIRKEDEVMVVRGLFKGKVGKIVQCQRKSWKVLVDNLVRTKTNKTSLLVPISPSNLIITRLDLSRERREKTGNQKLN